MPRKQDPFADAYREKILNHPILPEKEIRELLSKAQRGDLVAKHRVITHNHRLVWKTAEWYKKRTQDHDIFDLFQSGVIGLEIAITKFRLKKNVKFNTYALWWINQRIKTCIRGVTGWTRVPDNQIEECNKIKKQLREKLHREPSDVEFERHLIWLNKMADKRSKKDPQKHRASGKTSKHNLAAHKAMNPKSKKSLDDSRKNDPESGSFLLELLVGNRDGVGQGLDIESRRKTLTNFLKQLPERERRVFEMRFGLDGGKPLTLEETGSQLHVTRERIRQIEITMARRLRFLIIKHLLSEPGYHLQKILEAEEYAVINLLFGSNEESNCPSPKQVARRLKKTESKVSNILNCALVKIRNSLL